MLSKLGLHAEPVPAVPDSCSIFPSQQKLSSQVTVEMPVLPCRQHRVRGRAVAQPCAGTSHMLLLLLLSTQVNPKFGVLSPCRYKARLRPQFGEVLVLFKEKP